MRVLWVVVHESVEQNMCHRRHPHRGSGVTGVRLEGRIDLELREISIKFLSDSLFNNPKVIRGIAG